MKIVILGASGKIGSLILETLTRTHDVVGTSRSKKGKLLRFNPFEDNWSMLGKPDVIINCVGQIEATSDSSFQRIHVEMTRRIIHHREMLGNPRVVQLSALGATSLHRVEFLRTKGLADDLLLSHDNTVVIRPSIVCTPGTMIVRKMIMLAKLGRFTFGVVPIPEGFLETKVQPIMPDDLADVVEKACWDRGVRVVNAVGMDQITFRELIEMMMKGQRTKLTIVPVTRRVVDLAMSMVINPLLPGVINGQQYQLLFEDNIADLNECSTLIGRDLASTYPFFEKQFALTTSKDLLY